MNLRKLLTLCALLLWCGASVSSAGQEMLAEVAPLVTADHFVVVRVDVQAVGLDTVVKEFDDALQRAGQEKLSANADFLAFRQRVNDVSAAGGKTLYVLMDDPTGRYDPMLAATLDKTANPAALAKLFDATFLPDDADTDKLGRRDTVARMHAGLLLIGQWAVVDRAASAEPVGRQDLSRAMAAAGSAPVTVAVVPPESVMHMVVAQMPNLPAELGGGETAPLGQISWIGLGLSPAKKTPLALTIQCESAKAARNLNDLLDTIQKAANTLVSNEQDKHRHAGVSYAGMILVLGSELNLQVKDSAVVGRLDAKGKAAVLTRLANLLAGTRQAATIEDSRQNINHLCLGLAVYFAIDEERETFPPGLTTLVKETNRPATCLDNPRMPDREPGYLYVRPTKTKNDYGQGSRVIFVYENYDTWPQDGIVVGFIDSSTNIIKTEAEFKKLLDATHAANR